MTLLEAGWNANHQKAFLRLLRNRGALAALPPHRKVELARFFVGPQLRVGGPQSGGGACGYLWVCLCGWVLPGLGAGGSRPQLRVGGAGQ